jgi:hypothetical protein
MSNAHVGGINLEFGSIKYNQTFPRIGYPFYDSSTNQKLFSTSNNLYAFNDQSRTNLTCNIILGVPKYNINLYKNVIRTI